MTKPSEDRLSEWMLEHLSLAIAPFADRIELGHVESEVLTLLDPCLNLSKVPPTPLRGTLSTRRRVYTSPGSRPDAAPLVGVMRRLPARKAPPAGGMTPEELARELGLPNAKQIRGFLRAAHPRDPALLGSSWGPLAPELEQAVRRRFGGRA